MNLKEFEIVPKQHRIIDSLSAPTSLADIARITNLPRSTAEYHLKKLYTVGIIKSETVGKRKLYYVARKQNNRVLYSPICTIGHITIYQGVPAIVKLWQEISEMPAKSRLTGIQPWQSFAEAIKKSPIKTVTEVSQKLGKKFIFDAIVHEELAKSIFSQFRDEGKKVAKAFTGRLEDVVKVRSTFLNEKAEFFIIGNRLVFIDWFNEIAIKINGTHITAFMKAIYEATKAYGVRYNQSEYIEKLIKSTPPDTLQ